MRRRAVSDRSPAPTRAGERSRSVTNPPKNLNGMPGSMTAVYQHNPSSRRESRVGVKPPTKIYRMRLRSIGSDHDDIRRLRIMLKLMLRRFRFRVIEIEREQASEEHV